MAIIRKLSKNGKDYYYLEQSMREGKAVKMNRKYLGTMRPSDSRQIKEDFEIEIIEQRYSQKLGAVSLTKGKEYDKLPESAKLKFIESFLIKFTYNTNKIEGSTLSMKDTFDLLQDGISPSNRPINDIKETEGHKKAFYEMISLKKKITLTDVLHWHRVIFQETNPEISGKIRSHGVAIARSKVRLALPAEIEPLLQDFFRWYDKSKCNPVVKAALSHLKFVTIHPFTDGNGRISRLLMNYVLHSNGYPMINIDYTNRKAYYNALESSQLRNSVTPFLNYIIKRFIKEYA